MGNNTDIVSDHTLICGKSYNMKDNVAFDHNSNYTFLSVELSLKNEFSIKVKDVKNCRSNNKLASNSSVARTASPKDISF